MIQELTKMIKMQDGIIEELKISNEHYKKSYELQIKENQELAERVKELYILSGRSNDKLKKGK